jgi:hypothetical protein
MGLHATRRIADRNTTQTAIETAFGFQAAESLADTALQSRRAHASFAFGFPPSDIRGRKEWF